MHRHGYKGRKFGREKDQRRALIKGLAEALILNETIETTLAKAKQLVPYVEKLITISKNPSVANKRLASTRLNTHEAVSKLFDDISLKLKSRASGHLRIEKTSLRRGDNAQMAKVSFVDDLSAPQKKPAASKPKATIKPEPKKTSKKKVAA